METEKKAGHAYLLIFQADIEALNDNFASLTNVLESCRAETESDTFEEIYSKKKGKELPKEMRIELIQRIQAFRWSAIRCYMKYVALSTNFKSLNEGDRKNKIQALQSRIFGSKSMFAPNYHDLQEYTLEFNKIITDEVVSKALKTAQEAYSEWIKEGGS